MSEQDLEIHYINECDMLVFHAAEPSAYGETIAPDLWVIYGRADDVSSVSIYGAAKLLQPYLFPDDGHEGKRNGIVRGGMKILYAPETDTLELRTGYPPYAAKTVALGLYVNFDTESWAMGVILERAAERLGPYIGPGAGAGVTATAAAIAEAGAGAA